MSHPIALSSRVLRWHIILGYLALLPAVYMSMTGIAVGLSNQIERIMEPHIFSVEPLPAAALPQAAIMEKVSKTLGDSSFVLQQREGIFDTWQVNYDDQEPRVMWLNPYSAEVIADRAVATRPAAIIQALHTGDFFGWRGISSISAVLLTVVLMSGLICYRRYSQGRYFWHIQLGLISFPVTLFLAVSGILLPYIDIEWVYTAHAGSNTIIGMLLVASLLLLIGSLLSFVVVLVNKGVNTK